MHELMIAARTDEKLRATLQEVLSEFGANIFDVARGLPGVEGLSDETLLTLVASLMNTFDGAAILNAVLPQPELNAQKIALIAALLNDAYGAD
jgi:hypothetical protein